MTRKPPSGAKGWWAIALGWWSLSGFASAVFVHVGSDAGGASWWDLLLSAMSSALLWVPITVLAFWLVDRFPLERRRWKRSVAVHTGAAVGTSVFRAVVVVALNPWIPWYAELPPFSSILLRSFDKNLLFYWMLVGVAHGLHYARAMREREMQDAELRTRLVQAELQVLKAQLHPHFLFNTLHAISTLMHRDVDAADRMIARLSDLLRHTLETTGTQEVALKDELRFLEPYLEIEQTRFQDRLTVRWSVEPGVLEARVPHLILQPLVENSIKHGLAPRAAAGRIEIRAWHEDGSLRIEVRDDGMGLAREQPVAARPGGVGLTNTRARLEQLYGAEQSFELTEAPGGGVVAAMTIPFRPALA